MISPTNIAWNGPNHE